MITEMNSTPIGEHALGHSICHYLINADNAACKGNNARLSQFSISVCKCLCKLVIFVWFLVGIISSVKNKISSFMCYITRCYTKVVVESIMKELSLAFFFWKKGVMSLSSSAW